MSLGATLVMDFVILGARDVGNRDSVAELVVDFPVDEEVDTCRVKYVAKAIRIVEASMAC